MEPWGWIVVGAVGVGVLVVLDRLVARGVFDRRRPKRFRSIGGGVTSGALAELIMIFQPSSVHLAEEQARRQGDLVQPGDGAPPLRDLDGDEDTPAPRAG